MFKRNRFKKVSFLLKFMTMLSTAISLGFVCSIGLVRWKHFSSSNSILLSTENKKNRINEAKSVDKRTVVYKRRKPSLEKGTHAMMELLKHAKKADIPSDYVCFDSWFSSPSSLYSVKETG